MVLCVVDVVRFCHNLQFRKGIYVVVELVLQFEIIGLDCDLLF